MEPAIPTSSVHLEGDASKPIETSSLQVLAPLHPSNDVGEGDDFLVFATQ